jgi:hypothetical protein
MHLVRHRVGRPEQQGRLVVSNRAGEEEAQHRELRRVRELAQHEIPAAEPRPEVRNRRQREDQRRPRDHR